MDAADENEASGHFDAGDSGQPSGRLQRMSVLPKASKESARLMAESAVARAK